MYNMYIVYTVHIKIIIKIREKEGKEEVRSVAMKFSHTHTYTHIYSNTNMCTRTHKTHTSGSIEAKTEGQQQRL